MRITDHLITPATSILLNHGSEIIVPQYVVLHYDGGASLAGTVQTLLNRRLSYHLIIDRDGSIIQGVKFNKRAFHAGRSNYRLVDKELNFHSIGICFTNRGPVNKEGDRFVARNERGQRIGSFLGSNQVTHAYHPNGGRKRYWERYPEGQVAACREVCRLLIENYPTIVDIVGHDEVSIGRKIDPGPACPIEDFYDLVSDRGLAENNLYRVDNPGGSLNVRRGPSTNTEVYGVLQHDQLVYGRSLSYQSGRPTNWLSISLDGRHLQNGFVSSRYLKRVNSST